MESGEIASDPSSTASENKARNTVKEVINIVAKRGAPDAIKRLEKLSEEAISYVHLKNEPTAYSTTCTLLAQAYLKLTNSAFSSARSKT